MTDEQFQALAPYEQTFDDALKKGRAKYPGRTVIQSFLSVIRSTNPRYKTNLNCGVCVLHLVQDVARMYFGHKKDMERTAQAEIPAPKKTRKVLGLVPIEPVTEQEVDALVDAEKNGRIYIDQYEEPSAELVLTDEELAAYVVQASEIASLKEKIKSIEESLKSLDKRVLDYMLANNLETMEGGGGSFKLKKAYERTTIDTERMKKNAPGLYEMYKKTSTVAASVSFKKN